MLYLLLAISVEDLELWLVCRAFGLTEIFSCIAEAHLAAAL